MKRICENYVPASVEEVQTRIKKLRNRGYLPKDRAPELKEVEACTPYLDRQIKIIKPKIVVTLGRHSMSYILSKLGFEIRGITGVHGRVYDEELLSLKVRIIPTFHPAAALYNPKYKDALEGDFQVVKRELEKLGARST